MRSLPGALARLMFPLTLMQLSCGSGQQSAAIDSPQARVAKPDDAQPGKRWLVETAQAAERAGAGPLSVVHFGSGAPGDVVEAFVFIPKGRCGLVYARGSDAIEDLDLHAFADDGREFGSDEAPDARPVLLLCPDRDTRIYLAARVAQGHGLVALGLQDVDPEKSISVARAAGARNHTSDTKEVDEPWPGLDEALQNHREELGGHWTDQRRVALPVDSRVATHITVTVPVRRCLDAFALASEEVARLELLAEDQGGRVFARGRAKGPNRSLLFCAGEQAQDVKLLIRPHSGRGLTVLAISTTRSSQDRLDLNPAIPVHSLAMGQLAVRPATLSAARSHKTLSLRVGELSSFGHDINGCARLDLIPDSSLLGYVARIWSDAGDLLSASRGDWEAPMFFCGQGKVRFEAEATRRQGSLLVEVRETTKVAPVLVKLPLAASRLLARMQGAGVLQLADGVAQVEQIELQETKLRAQEFTISRGRCLDVFVAKDEGGFGVEARMLDRDSGLELAFARGGNGLEISSCAPLTTEVVGSLQIRTIRGAAPALIALHESPLSAD